MRKGELRREAIVRVAERLFFEKGYGETSIQDILDELSISKGGFYHHFDSKLSLLSEICRTRVEGEMERVREVLRNGLMDPPQKLDVLLNATLLLGNTEPKFAAMVVQLCYVEGDLQLREQLRVLHLAALRPLVEQVLAEGLMDESFFSRCPGQLGELLLLLGCNLNDTLNRILVERVDDPECALTLLETVDAYREAVELLCGAPHGKIVLVDVEHFMDTLRQTAQELKSLREKA